MGTKVFNDINLAFMSREKFKKCLKLRLIAASGREERPAASASCEAGVLAVAPKVGSLAPGAAFKRSLMDAAMPPAAGYHGIQRRFISSLSSCGFRYVCRLPS